MTVAVLENSPLLAEPLVRENDVVEYRQGLERRLGGVWDESRWSLFRVRFGVYGQKQPGVQMVRVKIPGGVIPVAWLRSIADVNRRFAQGDAHLTTRQDIQLYHVPLERSASLLEALHLQGLTTREACGNTLRNVTSCSLAGVCPREHVDAGRVAEVLSRSWIRHPLVQHMPRKAKITVSGCAVDCGHSSMHDLGFVATEQEGRHGFRVKVGGGLGAQPRPAVEVLSFVTEEQLPAVVETFARLHQRYSDRGNRNGSRIKFAVKRFGAEKFTALFAEEFERIKDLPQRPQDPLAWRTPTESVAIHRAPVGVVPAHDGTKAVVVSVPLGLLSSEQMDTLADLAEANGVAELRATRDQNIAFIGLSSPEAVERITRGVTSIGLEVPASPEDTPDVISCPGTTTCRIGITNSQSFARQVLDDARTDSTAKGVSVHVSGCQNSCGLHQVADFGLHGMAKKINGQTAPHYQIHLGGDARCGALGLLGPIVPAKSAPQAVALLRHAFAADGKSSGESVRDWATRLGRGGLSALLAPLEQNPGEDVFVDWGESALFPGAPQVATPGVPSFTLEELYAELADDGLISMDRALAVGHVEQARAAGVIAITYAARYALQVEGIATTDAQSAEEVIAAAGSLPAEILALRTSSEAVFREAVASLLLRVVWAGVEGDDE